MDLLASLVFFRLKSEDFKSSDFKSVSILSSRITCVLMQSRLWSLNQISEASAYLLKCMLKYVFCSLGQVKHGKY